MAKSELFDLKGKRALVTGGSGGLGFAIAEGFARHGADVVIIGRDIDRLDQATASLKKHGRGVWGFEFDLNKVEDIDELFGHAVKAAGDIDILINCAGLNLRGPAEKISLEVWEQVIRINLTAVFVLCQAFAKQRIGSDDSAGKIINIASLASRAARPTIAPYTASKGAILMLTRALAVEWAKYNISVNAIGPGYFVTEMTRPLKEDPAFNDQVIQKTPMNRWGLPEDLVGTAVYLASSASNFVTGQIVYVDGGWLAEL